MKRLKATSIDIEPGGVESLNHAGFTLFWLEDYQTIKKSQTLVLNKSSQGINNTLISSSLILSLTEISLVATLTRELLTH